jgi:hypothetical protein
MQRRQCIVLQVPSWYAPSSNAKLMQRRQCILLQIPPWLALSSNAKQRLPQCRISIDDTVMSYLWTRYPRTFLLHAWDHRSPAFWDPKTKHPLPMCPDPGPQPVDNVIPTYPIPTLCQSLYPPGSGHIVQGDKKYRGQEIPDTLFRDIVTRDTSSCHRLG